MPAALDLIREHIEYTIWATDRITEAAAVLSPEQRDRDFGTADKSVLGSLVHIFRSERAWRLRVKEGTSSIPYKLPEDEQWSVLLARWPVVHDDWRQWAANLSDTEADRMVNYTDLKGNPWAHPAWRIVLHMVNHSTHHRGQVSGFLRTMGFTPPPLDYIAWARRFLVS